jgi:hypothetical protein
VALNRLPTSHADWLEDERFLAGEGRADRETVVAEEHGGTSGNTQSSRISATPFQLSPVFARVR